MFQLEAWNCKQGIVSKEQSGCSLENPGGIPSSCSLLFPLQQDFWKQRQQCWGCPQVLGIPGVSMENIQGKGSRVAPEPEH